MSKSLNQAFLRAFSKGQSPAGSVPAPHVRGMASSNNAPIGTPLAADSGEWRRVEEQAGTKADPSRVPAPHLPVAQLAAGSDPYGAPSTFPPVPAAEASENTTPDLEPQETLIVSQLGAVSKLFGDPALVIIPQGPLESDAWNVAEHAPANTTRRMAEALPELDNAPLPAAATAAAAVLDPKMLPVAATAHTSTAPPASTTRWQAPAGHEHRFDVPPATSAAPQTHVPTPAPASAERTAHGPALENVSGSHAASQTATRATSGTFTAAWEVDRLGWSDTCNQLYVSETKYFQQAGRQLSSATGEGLNVLAITSAFRGEGRTTLALLLARCAAAAGVRVAVLDADLDNPQLAAAVKLQPESDWRSALEDDSQLGEAAVHAVEDGITLFPLQSAARGTGLSLADPAVTALVEDIGQRFELLVIDMGPTISEERRLFAAGDHCPINAAVVVRDMRSTGELQIQDIVGRLIKSGVEAVGIAENFVRRTGTV